MLLDSNLEIALKEFIVSRDDLFPPRQFPDTRIKNLFRSRHAVFNEVGKHINFTKGFLRKVNFYYGLRCKLIHERATVGITDQQVDDYRRVIEKVMKDLFSIKFPKRT